MTDAVERKSRLYRFLSSDRASETFKSSDFYAGTATFIVVLAGAGWAQPVRADGRTLLLAEAGLAVALLAVALTALTILVGVLGDEYLRVLEHAGGVPKAMEPYVTVSVVAGLGAISGVLAAVAYPYLLWLPRALVLAATSGLLVWAAWGTVQLVQMTAWHGVQRGRLLEGIADAKRQVRQLHDQRRAEP